MYYDIKKSVSKKTKRTKKKMNLSPAIKENRPIKNLTDHSKTLSFFPLSDEAVDNLCQNINKNLFQVEKDLAYFSFAIKEIKDISRF